MRFVTLFLHTKNVHLLKDVGMIPYQLHKEFEYDVSIATYENEKNYAYLASDVPGLQLVFIKKTRFGKILDGIRYLIANSSSIDVLNVYHLNLASFFWLLIYRMLRRKGSLSYLKLDMSYKGLQDCLAYNLKGWIKRKTIEMAEVVSVETTLIQTALQKRLKKEILYIPNGFLLPVDTANSHRKKENIILTVGNLGTWEKATDTLLMAFAEFCEKIQDREEEQQQGKPWILRLVGPIEQKFNSYIEDFYGKHPAIRSRVVFTDNIMDKKRLAEEYAKAKVFILPSRQESFGIVLTEAISEGCYIIAADRAPAGYDVSDKGKQGKIFEADNKEQLANVFREVCSEKVDWDQRAGEIRQFAKAHFLWATIIERLHAAIQGRH